MTYISVTDVRRASGVPTTLVSDTEITGFINSVEKDMERWLNTKFTPTEEIDVANGTGSGIYYAKRKPLLAVRELITNDTTITPSSLEVYKDSGKIVLGVDSEAGTHVILARTIRCRYIYALQERSDTDTVTTTASVAGSAIVLVVSSESGFTAGDWVEVYGIDGNTEWAKVTVVASLAITVDVLVFAHASGSKVVKTQVPEYIKRYLELEATIAVALNAIGSTYTFNASYNLSEFSVVKGVPYTHWRESFEKAVKERDFRRGQIRPQYSMAMS